MASGSGISASTYSNSGAALYIPTPSITPAPIKVRIQRKFLFTRIFMARSLSGMAEGAENVDEQHGKSVAAPSSKKAVANGGPVPYPLKREGNALWFRAAAACEP